MGVAWNWRTADASCLARRRLSYWSIRFPCFWPGSTWDIEANIWASETTAPASLLALGCL